MDPAYLETERIIRQMEKRLNDEYDQALKEVQATIDDYTRRFEKKDEAWRGWVKDGKRTQEEYEKWRYGQMAVGDRWEELKNQLATDMAHTNEIARGITLGYMPEIYAENFNFGTYELESATGIDTSFTLYNRDTVARIVRDDPKLLPEPGKKVSQEIREGKAVRWNRQHIQSAMMQSILQGESIPKMATRLQNAVGDSNRAAAIRNARTMATGAQNAGRFDAYKRGEEYGIHTKKEWRATLDSRTRHSHRAVDLEVVELDEEFSNGLMYPGDESGPPEEIYNCRCRMLSIIEGMESHAKRDTSGLEGMTYEEWKEAKEETNPITLPEEKARNIRNSYIAQYRRR